MKTFTVKFINSKTNEEVKCIEVKAKDKNHAIKKSLSKSPDDDNTYMLSVVDITL